MEFWSGIFKFDSCSPADSAVA
uniref:Uncharacterized protein n=1 Tax=Rhizophora mucronata TaxID=61149 RepID=A0A2P2Q020_RHIMU